MLSACAFGDTASDGGMPIHRSRGGERRGVGGGTTPVSSKNSLHDRLYASRLQTAEEQSPTYHANEALHPVAQRGGVPRKVEAAKCWTRARKARGPGRRRAANGTKTFRGIFQVFLTGLKKCLNYSWERHWQCTTGKPADKSLLAANNTAIPAVSIPQAGQEVKRSRSHGRCTRCQGPR